MRIAPILLALFCVAISVAHADSARVSFDERFGGPVDGMLLTQSTTGSIESQGPSNTRLGRAAISRDTAALPAPVRDMRDRLLAAAATGDIGAVQALIERNPVTVQLGLGVDSDAVSLWRSQYPESNGIEVLSILLDLLDSGYVRVDAGMPSEMYVWPYFAHVSLDQLEPPELVELYRLVTGYDVQQMIDAGAWTFFRLGISPDGTWHYFLASE